MATITPPSGKTGKITWAGFALYLSEWDAEVKVDIEEYQHFQMTADVNNLIFKGLIDGFASGTASVKGKFDNTAAAYLPTNKTVWPQVSATGYLGYNATVGFIITAMIESVRPAQTTGGDSAPYEATLRITSMTFTSTGP